MLIVDYGQDVCFEVDSPASEQQICGNGSGVSVAGAVPETVRGVWACWVWVGEECEVENLVAEFGGEGGEEGGSDLGVDVGVRGDFGDGGGFEGMAGSASSLDVVEGEDGCDWH